MQQQFISYMFFIIYVKNIQVLPFRKFNQNWDFKTFDL